MCTQQHHKLAKFKLFLSHFPFLQNTHTPTHLFEHVDDEGHVQLVLSVHTLSQRLMSIQGSKTRRQHICAGCVLRN